MALYFEMGYLVDSDPVLGEHTLNEIEFTVPRALVNGVGEWTDIVGDVDRRDSSTDHKNILVPEVFRPSILLGMQDSRPILSLRV